jgi:stage II sporulation protein D
MVRGFDLRIFQMQRWGLQMVSAMDKMSEWEFRCQEGHIRALQLHQSAKNKPLDLHEPVSVQTPVGFLHYGALPYRNELRIVSSGMLCDVVNHVELEKYLDGLVNEEFSSKWNSEAIAAQVVAARTYAYYQILESKKQKGSYFDLDATVKDQVYNGSMKEDFHSSRIATQTRGWVLTVGTSPALPIKAFYHSMCGGETELPENVWGTQYPGFKRKVACAYCSTALQFNWALDLQVAQLAQLILKSAEKDNLPEEKELLKNLALSKMIDLRTTGGEGLVRVTSVVSVWSDGTSVFEFPVEAARFRGWVGYSRLKSTLFELTYHRTLQGPAWHFSGRGNGHGVGLCQWGAKAMGEKGFKMADILKFYYPDAILKKLW